MLSWLGVILFVGGGITSLAGGPVYVALGAMVGGVVLFFTFFGRSPRWAPTQGSDADAKAGEARLWSISHFDSH